MLFNFTTHTSFPCKKPSYAIFCEKVRGPFFGVPELSAFDEPFNQENACHSWTNNSGYSIPHNSEGINMLTNQKYIFNYDECYFTITEIEVWGVSFNE